MAYLRGGEISAVRSIATKTGNPMAATEYRDERGVVHSVVAFGPVALKLITLAGQRVSMDGRWDVDGKRGTRFIADFVEPGSGHVVPEYAMPVPKSLSYYKEQQSKPEAPAPFQVVPPLDPRGDNIFSRKPECAEAPAATAPAKKDMSLAQPPYLNIRYEMVSAPGEPLRLKGVYLDEKPESPEKPEIASSPEAPAVAASSETQEESKPETQEESEAPTEASPADTFSQRPTPLPWVSANPHWFRIDSRLDRAYVMKNLAEYAMKPYLNEWDTKIYRHYLENVADPECGFARQVRDGDWVDPENPPASNEPVSDPQNEAVSEASASRKDPTPRHACCSLI